MTGRPAGGSPPRGPVTGVSGLRALTRLAWRDAARHPARSLLVATLLALPAAMVASATVLLRSSDLAASGSFGQGNLFMLVFLPVVAVAALTGAAALGVGARRQLHELGLLAAIGGSGRHLRGLVLLQGFGLGLVGGLAGIPVGLAVTWATFPLARTWLSPVQDETGALLVPEFSVVGRDMAWTVAFTAVLALLTALRPAITAGRVPGGRPCRAPPGPPVRPAGAVGLAVALSAWPPGSPPRDARACVPSRELLALGTFRESRPARHHPCRMRCARRRWRVPGGGPVRPAVLASRPRLGQATRAQRPGGGGGRGRAGMWWYGRWDRSRRGRPTRGCRRGGTPVAAHGAAFPPPSAAAGASRS